MSKALRNLIVIGVLGWLGWTLLFKPGPGERPPILISNGPVRIEAQPDGRGAGDFQKGLLGIGRSWYHHHPSQGPTHFEVVVADSSCGQDAKYDATEFTVISGGSGTSSTFTISVGGMGALTYLAVDPANSTKVNQDATRTPHQIEVGERDELLQSVRVAGSTCAFNPGQGSITINQRR
jgi:hypothetical protein